MNDSNKPHAILSNNVLGINLRSVTEYLLCDCKLDIGYEAQLVGKKIQSATTTAIIIYSLSKCKALDKCLEMKLVQELMSYGKLDSQGRLYFGTTHTNSWSTAQTLLVLANIITPDNNIYNTDLALRSYQTESGAWIFSAGDDESIIYSIYPTLAYAGLIGTNLTSYAESILERTKYYLVSYAPQNQTEVLIRSSLLKKIHRTLGLPMDSSIHQKPLWHKLITQEFNKLVWNEYTVYPFSMSMYGPSLYLFARDLVKPDHPFSLYCIRYLIDHVRADRVSWPLGQSNKSKRACSFCTALALLTLKFWDQDCRRNELSLPLSNNLYSLENIKAMTNNLEQSLNLFVSYSSADLPTVTKIVDVLKAQGYNTIFAEYDLLIGDSIPRFINDALAMMDFFIMCLSPDAVNSKYVRDEIEGAKASEWARQKKTILPVLLRPCSIPPIVAAKRYADFTDNFENGLVQLIQTLEKSAR